LQDLGEELMGLSAEQLSRMELPQELFEAVRLGQSITAHGGLQRQRKFIGKLLRGLDPEPIRARLADLRGESAEQTRLLHHCEQWRDRMLTDGDAPIDEFVGAHPEAERGKLRQLVRDARREQDAERPPRSARLLFRYLREILLAGPAASDLD
jgi:ribosome-associated protein